MNFHIITIFPQILDSYINESILKRARVKKIIKIKTHDLRKWTKDKHKTVDDRPFGGGAGMVLMAKPILKALSTINSKYQNSKSKTNLKFKNSNSKIVLLSAKGKKWDQAMAKKYAKLDNLILICGRYEGVDERIKQFVDTEISVGDYVLTGGELPAMIITDSITRLLPGVLGNKESTLHESHSEKNILEHPHYTRPEVFKINGRSLKVPKILLSGDHKKIEGWRKKNSKKIK
ncbi:MAG: tRNA (guanosine(37)-N1)-methyltransferase TrmD [Candidatus Falkowbacteria bacterium]